MFSNYIKTAIRSLKKNKGFTAINILGLALGLAVFLLIVFYVVDEMGYDTYNTNADRIYRINNEIRFGGNDASYAVSPAPMAAAIKAEFPEVENVTRFRNAGSFAIKKGNQDIREMSFVYTDPAVFSVFTLPMLGGNPLTALKEPNSVVITEEMALKYFHTRDVVGKTLVANDTTNFKITGVIKNIPKQSHFTFDFFLSMTGLADSKDPSWLNNNYQTYILLKPGADISKLTPKFQSFIRSHMDPQMQSVIHMNYDEFTKGGSFFKMTAMPLSDIHLRSNLQAELGQNGNIQYVYIFGAVAIFILLIACVNFMNLSTARSANRAREVGVRKVLGSDRKQLIFQFLAESMLITIIAAVIGVMGAWALLPVFNQMAAKELVVTASALIWITPSVLFIVVVIGLLAGSYPAFFLSAFQPIDVLKGKLAAGFKGGLLRNFLVVFQFSISIILVIGTLVIYNQLHYIQNKDLGYSRSHILVVKGLDGLGKQAESLKAEIKQLPGIADATLTGFTPTSGYRNSNSFFQSTALDVKSALNSQQWDVDEDYAKTLQLKFISGRDFSKEMPTDSTAMVVSEATVKQLGMKNPINKILYMPLDPSAKHLRAYHIIGVIKDFNFNSLRENVSPMILVLGHNRGALSIRVTSDNIPALISQIGNKWKTYAPNQQFNYSFMDQDFDNTYRSEQRIGSIFISFTTLAIVIACLGLFGLAAYAAEQRTKEVGIRKVLGANVSVIVAALTKDFLKLILVAVIVGSFIGWYVMHIWLQGFAYRQSVQWWVIAASGAGAILIAFITISFQSIKAALVKPVKSLRSE